jgi:phosphoglycerol transferase MdoB-like AlkP superfamily enzyme
VTRRRRPPSLGTVDRESYWGWVAAALFLLLPVDLLTTLLCAAVVGADAESNPWMAWLLTQSPTVLVAVHVIVGATAVAGFAVYESVSRRSERFGDVMLHAARVYLVLLVAVGFLVFWNNLFVLLFRRSLLAVALP